MTFSKGTLPRRLPVTRAAAAVTVAGIAGLSLLMLGTNPSFARQGYGGGHSKGHHRTHHAAIGGGSVMTWARVLSTEAHPTHASMAGVAAVVGQRMERSGSSVESVVHAPGQFARYKGKPLGPYMGAAHHIAAYGWRSYAGHYAHMLAGCTEFRTAGYARGRVVGGNVFLCGGRTATHKSRSRRTRVASN